MESRHFEMEVLDYNKFIDRNEVKEVTNPVFFVRDNIPTPDGLLSNDIFGISKDDRGNTFALIDLGDWFLHPLAYKILSKLNSKIKEVIHGTTNFTIDSNGELVEDPENGDTGIKFLKDNFSRLKFKKTNSNERTMNIKFIEENKDKIFINKIIIIPAYYRDVNTNANGYTGVGEINKLYSSLLVSVKALKESSDYGLSLASATRGRIQEIILQIYNWFGAGTTIDGQPTPAMLPSKNGLIRRTGMRKTTDYGSRLVMSAGNLRAEKVTDLPVDLDHSSVPLASVCVNFYPFILFNVRQFFDRQFSGEGLYPYVDKNNNIQYVNVEDYRIEFSDERIQKELDRFIHGYSNRFINIPIPIKDKTINKEIYMRFKGINVSNDEYIKNKDHLGEMPIVDRDLTWCDIFYMAAIESVKDKTILVTRFPIDTMYNQFPTMVNVSSTIETEPMIINNTFYPRYPKIRQEDIGSNTSNKFVDTMVICNAYLTGIGGDYDGDQVSVKGIYSEEANEELQQHMNSKLHYINLGAKNVRVGTNECIQSLYSLTLTLPDDLTTMSNPKF